MSSADQQGNTAKAPNKRRWLKPLLIISLGFNLLFAGLVAGRIWMHGYGGHSGGRNHIFTGAVEELMKTLPDDKRARAGALLKRHRSTVRELRKQNKIVRKAAEATVLSDPYDETRFAGVLARFREISNGQHQSMHTMMMNVLQGSTLKERQELLKQIHAGFRHRNRHWRRYGERSSRGAE